MKKFDIDWCFASIVQLLAGYDFKSVLDVGSGNGIHSQIFREAGKIVTSVDKFNPSADLKNDFFDINFTNKYDVIFCSHVVEHQRNPGFFLDKIHSILDDDGLLCIIGPHHDPNKLVEGHLTIWTLPFAIQSLILSGFDLSRSDIFSLYGYETSIICRKNKMFKRNPSNDVGYEFTDTYAWPFKPKQGLMVLNDNKFYSLNNNKLSDITIKAPRSIAPRQINRQISGDFRNKFQIYSTRWNSDIIQFN